nr:gamma-glutamylcyclotransferase family protein [Sneathiella limimaris]
MFVYGTLRRDFPGPMIKEVRRYCQFVETGTVRGKLYDLGSYPGFVDVKKDAIDIVGDIMELKSPDALAVFDEYEECGPSDPKPWPYVRKRLPVLGAGGKKRSAWVYLYTRSTVGFTEINSGDFLTYWCK